ncbi:D-3-phosphoglycerate dehydrogenase [Saccharopolyspora lacisalsi]|uniref:D-3-phosphoglycerate dehydrogenase n=1 Tax=Halosaccharopolyspora lacisalsi TaxID=1000566 RepID=A0A839DXL5_9PSEU|nr:NAD(P)-dependent oxidoreductase [Halosaccharopolyspora lacisalsi]MBA8824966.1 D-3-phosphoglycerate dehydrogenase [Halosaccharopolyspora lacisalsi]
MRILVADTFPETPLNEITRRAHDCAYEPETTTDQLPDKLDGHEVLVVRSTRVPAEVFDRADGLRLVIRAGSGTDTIDLDAASARGVHVCNVPGRNAVAVAELACALLLALDRDIVENVTDLRAGRWDKKHHARACGILGRRIGVLGLGKIGLAFAERATAFGAEVHAVTKPERDRQTLERARAIGVHFVDSLHELARTCDALSLHLPATEATRGLVDRELLSLVQPGTIILNTSRAELVDEDALIEAMDDKGVRAGLDVFADEPAASTGNIDSRLAGHPGVYGTHHIGASTEQAQHAVATEVVRMLDAFDAGEVPHCVNPGAAVPAQQDQPVSPTPLSSGRA